jgi:hypothetical protein
MSSKIDRAAHGPSWTEVILGAALSVILGAILGALLLVVRPVKTVKALPKEEERDPRAVYYLEGSRDPAKGRQALAKRAAFAGGQSVTVVEEDLNLLVAAGPAEKAAPPKGKEAPPAPADRLLTPGTPNFRIADGALQVGVPVTVSTFGLTMKSVVQARGGFVRVDGVFVFQPAELLVGSCPVQRLPWVAGLVRNRLLGSQPLPEDVKAAWGRLAGVTIEGNALKLTMP